MNLEILLQFWLILQKIEAHLVSWPKLTQMAIPWDIPQLNFAYKYYSPTVSHGKNFVLDFCIL